MQNSWLDGFLGYLQHRREQFNRIRLRIICEVGETGVASSVGVTGCHSVCLTHSSSSRQRGPWCHTVSSSSCQACWGPVGKELRGAGGEHASGRPGRSPPRRGPVRSHCFWTRWEEGEGWKGREERKRRRWKDCTHWKYGYDVDMCVTFDGCLIVKLNSNYNYNKCSGVKSIKWAYHRNT